MTKPLIAVSLCSTFVLAAAVPVAVAQQKLEGTVASAKLTACDPKPGGCEGHVVVEPRGAGSAPVTFKVVKGTHITEGDKHRFLLATNRRFVAITYVEEKGEKIAKAIEVKPKP